MVSIRGCRGGDRSADVGADLHEGVEVLFVDPQYLSPGLHLLGLLLVELSRPRLIVVVTSVQEVLVPQGRPLGPQIHAVGPSDDALVDERSPAAHIVLTICEALHQAVGVDDGADDDDVGMVRDTCGHGSLLEPVPGSLSLSGAEGRLVVLGVVDDDEGRTVLAELPSTDLAPHPDGVHLDVVAGDDRLFAPGPPPATRLREAGTELRVVLQFFFDVA